MDVRKHSHHKNFLRYLGLPCVDNAIKKNNALRPYKKLSSKKILQQETSNLPFKLTSSSIEQPTRDMCFSFQ